MSKPVRTMYYVERPDHVLVLAVWGAVRGAGPDLTGTDPSGSEPG